MEPNMEQNMKIKEPLNTVMRKSKYKSVVTDITLQEFKDKARYFFTGKNLERITDLRITGKTSFFYVTIITEVGEYDVRIRKTYGDTHQPLMKKVYEAYDDKITYVYETIKDFAIDFKKSTEKDFKILDNYRKQLAKKEAEMKITTTVLKTIKNQIPEFFL